MAEENFVDILISANDGSVTAVNTVADMTINYKTFKQTFNSKLENYINQNPDTSYSLYIFGCMHEFGVGIEQNFSKAIEFYQKAIKMDNSCAMNALANIYLDGKGIKKNLSKAFELYNQAIKFDNASALNNLGLMYQYEISVEKAKELYKKSIELGNTYAMNNLATIYYDNETNEKKALELLSKAMEKNNPEAYCNFAFISINSGNNVKAKELFQKAIDLGSSGAMIHVADHDDDSDALELYQKAVEYQNPNAMLRLATYYYFIEKNYDIAEKLFKQAIDYGNENAVFHLAKFYSDKKNPNYNYDEAKKLYMIGISAEDPDAVFGLATLYKNSTGINKNFDVPKTIFDLYNLALNMYEDEDASEKVLLELIELCRTHGMWNELADVYLEYDCIEQYINIICTKILQKKNHTLKQILKLIMNENFESVVNDEKMPTTMKMFYIYFDKKMRLLNEHFNYAPESVGYLEAKEHFDSVND